MQSTELDDRYDDRLALRSSVASIVSADEGSSLSRSERPTGIVLHSKKGKGSPYSITERRVPELIPVLGSQPPGDVSHKPGGRLPLLSARPATTPATLKRAATNFAAW